MQFSFIATNLRVWTTSGDPYTSPVAPATIDASTALEQFRSTYNASPPPSAANRDLAHLFTGRDIAGNNNTQPNTIGIAYQPGLDCPFEPEGYGYGMSENILGNRAGLTAHEIGHNLSASHVNSGNGADCSISIMNPSLNSDPAQNNFCQFSKDEITSHSIQVSNCLTPLTQPGCTYSLSQTTHNLPSAAGGNAVNVITQAGCNWAVAEGAGWLTVTGGASGTGSGTVSYSVAANDGICGPRTALVSIGGPILTVTQAGKPDYLTDPALATAISPGQTLNGNLSAPDCTYAQVGLSGGDQRNAFMDQYKFFGMAGQKIRIEMNANVPPPDGPDTFLYLYGPDGNIVDFNDDIVIETQTNSRIPCPANGCGLGFRTLTQTGTYIIIATSYRSGDTGAYTVTLTSEPLLLTTQFTDSVGTAAALNSVTFARSSNSAKTAFRIFDPFNFSADQTTRLILFTSDLGLPSQLNPSPTGPNALLVSAGGQDLLVENVGPFSFPGLSGSYVVVALKRRDGQPMATGNLAFNVTCRTLTSNVATIAIAP